MLRGLFRPKWIIVHVGVVALIVLMMNLGFWQLRRLDEKRTFNAMVTSRSEMPVQDISRVTGPTAASVPPGGVEWRRVSVEGTYDFSKAVRVVNRSQNGVAGYDEVVPLRTARFGWIIVNRGFIPLAAVVSEALPPDPVTVVGYLRESQTRGVLGSVDSTDPANRDFQRFDIPLMSRQLNGDTFPMWLQMFKESPTTIVSWPAPAAFPELTEGPHRSYAVQWFFFSSVALAAWVVVVRRKWREDPVSPPPTQA